MDDTISASRTAARRRDRRPGGRPARPADVLVTRCGGELAVRPAGPQDVAAAAGLHARCSARTLLQRYRGPAAGADAYLPHLLSPHFGHSLAAWSAPGRMVALGHALWDGDEAEVALLVEDSWQRRGVGAGLLRRLVSAAARTGRTRVYAVAQPPGTGMAAVIRGLRLPSGSSYEEDAVVITASTVPVSAPSRPPRPGRCRPPR